MSYSAYLYRRNDLSSNPNPTYKALGLFGFDTALSPLGVVCDCDIFTEVRTGETAAKPAVQYGAVLINTLYLFAPLAALALLVVRKRERSSGR